MLFRSMRKMPEFIFLPDNSLEYSAHIDDIIAHLPKPAQSDENGENDAEDTEVADEEN